MLPQERTKERICILYQGVSGTLSEGSLSQVFVLCYLSTSLPAPCGQYLHYVWAQGLAGAQHTQAGWLPK